MREHVADQSVDLIFTDPPYGISGQTLDVHYNRDDSKVLAGYLDVTNDEYDQWCHGWIQECERVLRPGGSLYIVSGYSNLHHVLNGLHRTRLVEINHIIAQYSFGVYTKKKWVSSHYHVLYWAKPGKARQKRTFNTDCRFSDTTGSYNDRLSVQKLCREYKHGEIRNSNQLAESFIDKFIEYSSNPGDLVLDPFGGSFSTGRSALRLGRRFVGFEINAHAYHHFAQTLDNQRTIV